MHRMLAVCITVSVSIQMIEDVTTWQCYSFSMHSECVYSHRIPTFENFYICIYTYIHTQILFENQNGIPREQTSRKSPLLVVQLLSWYLRLVRYRRTRALHNLLMCDGDKSLVDTLSRPGLLINYFLKYPNTACPW